jgi:hypothetical protein
MPVVEGLTIAVTCISLANNISTLMLTTSEFAAKVCDANEDMNRLLEELVSVKMALEKLKADGRSGNSLPRTIEQPVHNVMAACDEVVSQLQRCLKKYKNSKLRYAISGQNKVLKLRSNLDVHKSALMILLQFQSANLARATKNDTRKILGDTAELRAEIAELRKCVEKLEKDKGGSGQSGIVLKRYLEEMATYTESGFDSGDWKDTTSLGSWETSATKSSPELKEHPQNYGRRIPRDEPIRTSKSLSILPASRESALPKDSMDNPRLLWNGFGGTDVKDRGKRKGKEGIKLRQDEKEALQRTEIHAPGFDLVIEMRNDNKNNLSSWETPATKSSPKSKEHPQNHGLRIPRDDTIRSSKSLSSLSAFAESPPRSLGNELDGTEKQKGMEGTKLTQDENETLQIHVPGFDLVMGTRNDRKDTTSLSSWETPAVKSSSKSSKSSSKRPPNYGPGIPRDGSIRVSKSFSSLPFTSQRESVLPKDSIPNPRLLWNEFGGTDVKDREKRKNQKRTEPMRDENKGLQIIGVHAPSTREVSVDKDIVSRAVSSSREFTHRRYTEMMKPPQVMGRHFRLRQTIGPPSFPEQRPTRLLISLDLSGEPEWNSIDFAASWYSIGSAIKHLVQIDVGSNPKGTVSETWKNVVVFVFAPFYNKPSKELNTVLETLCILGVLDFSIRLRKGLELYSTRTFLFEVSLLAELFFVVLKYSPLCSIPRHSPPSGRGKAAMESIGPILTCQAYRWLFVFPADKKNHFANGTR